MRLKYELIKNFYFFPPNYEVYSSTVMLEIFSFKVYLSCAEKVQKLMLLNRALKTRSYMTFSSD